MQDRTGKRNSGYMRSMRGGKRLFHGKERAVLALTEAVTRIGEHGLPDEIYNEVRTHFTEAETAELIMAAVTINAWNRIAIATRKMPAAD